MPLCSCVEDYFAKLQLLCSGQTFHSGSTMGFEIHFYLEDYPYFGVTDLQTKYNRKHNECTTSLIFNCTNIAQVPSGNDVREWLDRCLKGCDGARTCMLTHEPEFATSLFGKHVLQAYDETISKYV
jgi:hypothetical protein